MSRLLTKGFLLCTMLFIFTFSEFSQVMFPSIISVSAQPNVPYIIGNWTYVNKPTLPVYINESQIPVGSNWTYIYTLEEGSAYRVYCYGDWIDYSTSINKTDYDIFVYDPNGNLQSYHTEAAGLPEHLGTTVDHPYFMAEQSGNFSFLIKNDARESSGAKAATLMIIEHIEVDTEYSRTLQGKINDQPVEKTTWAYEFNTTSNHIEVQIEVPDTLDMYEARLYLMANPSQDVGTLLNGVPLAWEQGLYGNTYEFYGGYNLDSDGFRLIDAIASCEYPGEDMFINFIAPAEGNLLYHLALIAEHGEGSIDFSIKTDFDTLTLNVLDPIEKANPNMETTITVEIEDQTNIEEVTLYYTNNNWATSKELEMTASQSQIYAVKIPGQAAGTIINYKVLARDILGNTGQVIGNFEVKNPSTITLDFSKTFGYLGENITVTGTIPGGEENVTLEYSFTNLLVTKVVSANSSGIFSDVFYLNQTGTCTVAATWIGNNEYFGVSSNIKDFIVNEVPPPITYIKNPVLPVYIGESQIPVGSNWTYIYTLEEGSAYRVYCYGDWIDYSTSTNKTDYDIFVYDPNGNLQSYHTEAAGLPEHLATIDGYPFFIPKQSGNYSFFVKNDLKESSGAKAATFMIIEHIVPNKWYQLEMEGKINHQPVEKTTWAYEFNTTSTNFEVWVKVPEQLDMYEARIYPMANPSSDLGTILNQVPLAWEPGLYANTSGKYGGYNLDSDGFRFIDAMASCEYSGEDMIINFIAPDEGNLLYHLALIAENGEGTIDFLIKTDFDAPVLNLLEEIKKTSPNTETTISVNVLEESNLQTMELNYTNDDSKTYTTIDMLSKENGTYIATISGQQAGTIINYTIVSSDITGNTAELQSSYVVKNTANITLDLPNSVVEYGKNITITGSLPIGETNLTLNYDYLDSFLLNGTTVDDSISIDMILNYTQGNSTISRIISTDSSGDFSDQYSLNKTGTWLVWATWNGSEEYFGATSDYRNFTINKKYFTLTCSLPTNTVTIGDNITVIGSINPKVENLTINVSFTSSNSTIAQKTYTDSNGTYLLSWKPDLLGLWQVSANIGGNASINAAYSNVSKFFVDETFLNQYLLYIIGGVAGVCGVSVIVFIIKRREEE